MPDETVVRQRGEELTLFATLDPAARQIVHLNVYPVRNYLTARFFSLKPSTCTGTVPSTIVTDDAQKYGDAFVDASMLHVVFHHGPRSRIERWFQELKRWINSYVGSLDRPSTRHEIFSAISFDSGTSI
jgi:transposase-like protein